MPIRLELKCIDCGATYPLDEVRYTCDCGGLLDVARDLEELREHVSRETFDRRLGGQKLADASGVWRFRELILPVPEDQIVSRPEGNTPQYRSTRLAQWVGLDDLALKHEGENPTGSFKDRGMTAGVTQAKQLGARAVACASTGNTSASLASYGAIAGLPVVIFVPEGKIAFGKLSQALAYGAKTLQVKGDFDVAMRLVQDATACRELDIYLLNSINPFRVEGQKAIVFEMLQQREWQPPDWIVLPAGNLGNTSAFGKALYEAHQLGLISRVPRLAAVQAQGANPFYRSFTGGFSQRERVHADTIATAIKIGDPVSFTRAVRAIEWTNGIVTQVSDAEIMDAKAQVDAAGIGCEPASASSVAGIKRLVAEGVIQPGESAVAILTGHLLKDPGATVDYHLNQLAGITPAYANAPVVIEPTVEAVRKALMPDVG
jgi:threonine synthase